MAVSDSSTDARESGNRVFPTTHWSVVLRAGEAGGPQGVSALEELCRAYWYPLYAFVRRKGYSAEDAQDLVQQFFVQLLRYDVFGKAEPGHGKLRSYLLACLRNFLTVEWQRATAQKRGGGRPVIPISELEAEEHYCRELADEVTPESLFERAWAVTVLDRVCAQLRQDYEAAGQGDRFRLLEDFLLGEAGQRTYAQAAQALGATESAVKSELHRLRARFRLLLRGEIAQTVNHQADIDEEIRALVNAIRQVPR